MEQIRVYHQCGFRYNWNLASFTENNVGDGLIISPVNMKPNYVGSLARGIKSSSFFDPQFYLPASEHDKLNAYEFFPNKVMEGFITEGFSEHSSNCADLCIDYQIRENFEHLVIPSRFYEDLPHDYLDQLRGSFVEPFLNCYRQSQSDKDIILSSIVSPKQLDPNNIYRDDLLNYLTESTELTGIYLIPCINSASKRIKDINFLFNLLTFIDVLRQNDLKVFIGYTDIEGLLYSLADISSLPLGSFDNLRHFATPRFERPTEERGFPPTVRIYSHALLQSIDNRYIESLRGAFTDDQLYEDTVYKAEMFDVDYTYSFQKAASYKHYFISYANQILALPNNFEERYTYVTGLIRSALDRYEVISDRGVYLGDNDDGSHLPMWLTAIARYYNYKTGR